MEYYLLIIRPTYVITLDLEPTTISQARKSLSWQVTGGEDREDLAICTRIGKTKFKCHKTGKEYEVENAIFTPDAWQRFLDAWEEE